MQSGNVPISPGSHSPWSPTTTKWHSFRSYTESIQVIHIHAHQGSYITNDTKISEVNISVFIYKLFHEDFSSVVGTHTADDWGKIFMKQSAENTDKLTSVIFVYKTLHWALCSYQVWFQNKSKLCIVNCICTAFSWIPPAISRCMEQIVE